MDVPDVLRWKGIALMGLGRYDEALHVLTSACSLAKESDSNFNLWSALACLAEVCSLLDQHQQADMHRQQAQLIVAEIAEGLREIGLRDSFLNQPRVQKLILEK